MANFQITVEQAQIILLRTIYRDGLITYEQLQKGMKIIQRQQLNKG